MVVEILICEVMCFEICACISACMFICHETLTQHVLRNVFFVSRGGLFVQPQPDENHWVYHSTRRSCQAEASVFWHVVPAFHSPFIQNGMLAIVQILLHNTTIIKISLLEPYSLDSKLPNHSFRFHLQTHYSLDSTTIVQIPLATQPYQIILFGFYWQPNHSLDSTGNPTIVQILIPNHSLDYTCNSDPPQFRFNYHRLDST